ncbi:hypothetical protein GY45DRAFT_850719 [Cubamyces sp. BRFM 1775]|nr:hypothetical protein GY45DRAFT_850719 [Cubamyces sp. BRFM 1775]
MTTACCATCQSLHWRALVFSIGILRHRACSGCDYRRRSLLSDKTARKGVLRGCHREAWYPGSTCSVKEVEEVLR